MLVRDGGSVGAREALGEVRKAAVHSRSADVVGLFLFKQKTAYEVRMSDGSSDVCSSDLNDLATGLARISGGLSRATPGSTGSAQLLDQRDQILEQMSALSDISVTMDVAGRATVKLGSASGPVFVTPGVDPGKILYRRKDRKSTRLNYSH